MFPTRRLAAAANASTVLLLFATQASAATYHVSMTGNDGNPGTQANAFRTVHKGVNVAGPGDTVVVHAG